MVNSNKEQFNVEYEGFIFKEGYPAVENDKKLFELVISVFNEDEIKLEESYTFSEDFAFYQKEVPGIFSFIGTKNEKMIISIHFTTTSSTLMKKYY